MLKLEEFIEAAPDVPHMIETVARILKEHAFKSLRVGTPCEHLPKKFMLNRGPSLLAGVGNVAEVGSMCVYGSMFSPSALALTAGEIPPAWRGRDLQISGTCKGEDGSVQLYRRDFMVAFYADPKRADLEGLALGSGDCWLTDGGGVVRTGADRKFVSGPNAARLAAVHACVSAFIASKAAGRVLLIDGEDVLLRDFVGHIVPEVGPRIALLARSRALWFEATDSAIVGRGAVIGDGDALDTWPVWWAAKRFGFVPQSMPGAKELPIARLMRTVRVGIAALGWGAPREVFVADDVTTLLDLVAEAASCDRPLRCA